MKKASQIALSLARGFASHAGRAGEVNELSQFLSCGGRTFPAHLLTSHACVRAGHPRCEQRPWHQGSHRGSFAFAHGGEATWVWRVAIPRQGRRQTLRGDSREGRRSDHALMHLYFSCLLTPLPSLPPLFLDVLPTLALHSRVLRMLTPVFWRRRRCPSWATCTLLSS
jgi:hypothetical protein